MAADEFGPVDFDLLADYIGGALDGPDEAAVARLIAEDPRWRETYELLAPGMAAVGVELSGLGSAPEPMPADLAVRLEQAFMSSHTTAPIAEPTVIDPALAAPIEPHLEPVRGGLAADRHLSLVPGSGDHNSLLPGSGDHNGDDRGDGDRSDHVRGSDVRSRRKRLRWAAPIAVAAGVLAFAGVGIGYLAGAANDSSRNATSAAGSAEQPAPMMDEAESAGRATALRDDQILSTGTNYTDATLGSSDMTYGTDRAKAAQSTAESPGVAELDAGKLSRLHAPAALQTCLEAITQATGQGPIAVQTVDYARYDGRPALVVRFTAGGMTWSFAAGPNCGTPGRGADQLKWVQVR